MWTRQSAPPVFRRIEIVVWACLMAPENPAAPEVEILADVALLSDGVDVVRGDDPALETVGQGGQNIPVPRHPVEIDAGEGNRFGAGARGQTKRQDHRGDPTHHGWPAKR